MTNWPTGGESLAIWTTGCCWVAAGVTRGVLSGGAGGLVGDACVVALWIQLPGESRCVPGCIVLVAGGSDISRWRMLHLQPVNGLSPKGYQDYSHDRASTHLTMAFDLYR